ELPPTVDPRLASLVAAVWACCSIGYLARAGAASATYFQTTGWLGVMELTTGSPLPDKFPSRPGMVFPVWHVLADVGDYAGGNCLPIIVGEPGICTGLA